MVNREDPQLPESALLGLLPSQNFLQPLLRPLIQPSIVKSLVEPLMARPLEKEPRIASCFLALIFRLNPTRGQQHKFR